MDRTVRHILVSIFGYQYLAAPGCQPRSHAKAYQSSAEHVVLNFKNSVAAAAKRYPRMWLMLWPGAGARSIAGDNHSLSQSHLVALSLVAFDSVGLVTS